MKENKENEAFEISTCSPYLERHGVSMNLLKT